jgi:hypothetical protein
MADLLPAIHNSLNTAYIIFSFILGFWSAAQFIRERKLGGQFWGALATNTLLAVAIFLLALVMALGGIQPARGVYFLYGAYFMIVLPGTFALLRGRDDRTAALIYMIVTIFSGLAAFRVPLLTQPWTLPAP